MSVLSAVKNFFCDLFGIETKEEKAQRAKEESSAPEAGAEQEAASDKEKEEKERKWKDLTEELKFVCHGGKIQCTFCSTPIVDILATSTQVMLQDKPYVTINDKDGKKNFAFTGTCNHPSQQKPSSPPPPCKAVISLGAWKDYSETMIDEYNAILVKSTIPCMISGQDLKVMHSGQMAELAEVKPKVKRNPQIIESYWINEDNERIEKIRPNKFASLVVKTKDYKKSDELRITLPVDGEEKEFVTHVNSQGIAIFNKVFYYKDENLKKESKIIEAYWRDKKGKKISERNVDEKAELFILTEGYEKGSLVTVSLTKSDKSNFESSGCGTIKLSGEVNSDGIAIINNNKWL